MTFINDEDRLFEERPLLWVSFARTMTGSRCVKYLLDSNVIIALVLNSNANVASHAAECDAGDLVTSAVAYAEVVYGSLNRKPPPVEQLRAFVEEVRILDFDYKAALTYGTLPFKRASYGRLIAAHALSHDLIVVTDNVKHYADAPRLQVENWITN